MPSYAGGIPQAYDGPHLPFYDGTTHNRQDTEVKVVVMWMSIVSNWLFKLGSFEALRANMVKQGSLISARRYSIAGLGLGARRRWHSEKVGQDFERSYLAQGTLNEASARSIVKR